MCRADIAMSDIAKYLYIRIAKNMNSNLKNIKCGLCVAIYIYQQIKIKPVPLASSYDNDLIIKASPGAHSTGSSLLPRSGLDFSSLLQTISSILDKNTVSSHKICNRSVSSLLSRA